MLHHTAKISQDPLLYEPLCVILNQIDLRQTNFLYGIVATSEEYDLTLNFSVLKGDSQLFVSSHIQNQIAIDRYLKHEKCKIVV